MPHPPLEIGTWGNIPAPIEVAPGVFRSMTRYRDPNGATRKVEARAASRNKARYALETHPRARQVPASREVTPGTRLRDVVMLWEAELVERGRAANVLK